MAVYKKLTLKTKLKLKNVWRKIYHALTNLKKARVDKLISDKADFRVWNISSCVERHYIMKKSQFMNNT